MVMPLVRVHIFAGTKLLAQPVKPFAADVLINAVINKALEAVEGVKLVGLVEVFKDAENKQRTAQLDVQDLGAITVDELIQAGFGTNLTVHTVNVAANSAGVSPGASTPFTPTASQRSSGSTSSSMPDSLQDMMSAAKGEMLMLPPKSTGSFFKHAIFNALLTELELLSLGWPRADAADGGSGSALLKELAAALQYTLPFHANGALARRSIHIPNRFGHEQLGVRARPSRLPPTRACHLARGSTARAHGVHCGAGRAMSRTQCCQLRRVV